MKRRNHIQLITELEEARGGNGGDITKLNEFLAYIETITPAEARVLSAYADGLKKLAESIIRNQKPIDKDVLN